MIKVGIIGSTGYAGQELVRILLQHPEAEIVWYGSRSYIDKQYYEVFQNMFELVDAKCLDDNMDELAEKADVIFMDPPYALGYYERALMLCVPLMSESSVAVLEHDSANPLPERFSGCVLYKRKQYGKRAISIYRKESEQ